MRIKRSRYDGCAGDCPEGKLRFVVTFLIAPVLHQLHAAKLHTQKTRYTDKYMLNGTLQKIVFQNKSPRFPYSESI